MSGVLLALALAGAAWPAGPAAPGEPVAMWVRLRAMYVDYLRGVPEDPVGLRAAEFLRDSTVTLEAADLKVRLGDDVFAVYDASRRSIQLDRRGLDDVWLPLRSAELQPERAGPFVERTAGAMVHEIRHAIDHAETGEPPTLSEHELIAYADQALFLWRRLMRDPAYRGLDAFDRAVCSRLEGGPGGGPRWWARPLPKSSPERLRAAVGEAEKALREQATSQEANDWFLARAFARGMEGFRAWLADAGYLSGVSLFEPPAGVEERSRSELEHLWRELAVIRSSNLPPQERQRRAGPLEKQLEGAETLAAFWGDGARREKAAARLRTQIADDEKQWEVLHVRRAD